jgi:hypothetical protein
MDAYVDHAQNFERRTGFDRRQRHKPVFSKYWLIGKRETPRRKEDRQWRFHPDRYSPRTFVAILLIVMLSMLDAIFTLVLISRGATELNPIMNYYLGYGPRVFFVVKYLLTFASILLILFHKHVYLFRGRVQAKILFVLVIIPFVLVVPWEIYLLFFLN